MKKSILKTLASLALLSASFSAMASDEGKLDYAAIANPINDVTTSVRHLTEEARRMYNSGISVASALDMLNTNSIYLAEAKILPDYSVRIKFKNDAVFSQAVPRLLRDVYFVFYSVDIGSANGNVDMNGFRCLTDLDTKVDAWNNDIKTDATSTTAGAALGAKDAVDAGVPRSAILARAVGAQNPFFSNCNVMTTTFLTTETNFAAPAATFRPL